MASDATRAIRRLGKELKKVSKADLKGVSMKPDGENYLLWKLELQGPSGSPYEKGRFLVDLAFPPEYPMKAPTATFKTKIYHPQIETKTGELCTRVIENSWAPTLNVLNVVNTLLSIMKEPSKSDFVEASIAEELANSPKKFFDTAKKWTSKYAKK